MRLEPRMGYRFLRREVSFFLVVTVTPLLGSTSGKVIFAALSSCWSNGRGSGIWLQRTCPLTKNCVAQSVSS